MEAVDLPRNLEENRVPCGPRSPGKAELRRTRQDARDSAVRALNVKHHPQEVPVALLRVEVPESRLHGELRIASPAVLLAVGAVRRDADEVGEVAALSRRLQGCEGRVGRRERPGAYEVRMDEAGADGLDAHIADERRLHVAESVVREARMPPLAAGTPRERVFVVLHRSRLAALLRQALDVPEQRPIARDGLVVVERHLRAGRADNLDLAPTGDVRAEVVKRFSVRRREHLLRLECLAFAARDGVVRAHDAPGNVLFHLRGTLVRPQPLPPCVVPLTVAEPVEDDWRVVGAPGAIRGEETGAVGHQFAADHRSVHPRRIHKAPDLLCERVLPSVAKQDFKRVHTLLQQLRHVEVKRRRAPVGLTRDR